MPEPNATVAVYETHTAVKTVVERLQCSGFDLGKLSVAARDNHVGESVTGYYNHGGRVRHWGGLGTFWDNLCTLLTGWAFLCIPGIGPVLIAGPLAGWIIAGLENEGIFEGLGALAAGLYSIGISRVAIAAFEEALREGKYLVLVHGTSADVARANRILSPERSSQAFG